MSENGGRAAYEALTADLRETAVIASAGSVLGWDQETMLPPAAAPLRGEQAAAVSAIVHQRFTREQVGEWLAAAGADPELTADPRAAANLREIRRDYERAVRLPESLVREIARTTALAQQAWRSAREGSDYAVFAPWLQRVLSLSRARAECYRADAATPLYDVLLDIYEPGAKAAELESVFAELRARLAPLIAGIAAAGPRPAPRVQAGDVAIPLQQSLNTRVAERMGFDFDAGRLDVSTHPFCEGIGPGDTRLTTRYREDAFTDSLSSTMHEVGHGLYEQGLPKAELFGQPLAEAASLGIHESQSRLWENLVGRSREFWRWALPHAWQLFGAAMSGVTEDDLYRAMNRVEPGLIRVDSDEATYNLHVMLRFDLERALLADELPVAELPGAWGERVRADLGLEVPDDRRGCLQDIHWSMGAVGYFPTYTLGNLYAAQLWSAARRALPDLDEGIARGEFAPLLGWLRENVHRHGRELSAAELCERATGSPLSAAPFLEYLEGKLRPLYEV